MIFVKPSKAVNTITPMIWLRMPTMAGGHFQRKAINFCRMFIETGIPNK